MELVDAFFESVGESDHLSSQGNLSKLLPKSKEAATLLRCKEQQHISQTLSQMDRWHTDARSLHDTSYELANALEAGIAQDEWLLYAARPIEVRTSWANLRLKLVYTHGVWPDKEWVQWAKWSLDFRVGPQSMRKKMVCVTDNSTMERLVLETARPVQSTPRHSPPLLMKSPRKPRALQHLSSHALGLGEVVEIEELDGSHSDIKLFDGDETSPESESQSRRASQDGGLDGFMGTSELPEIDLFMEDERAPVSAGAAGEEMTSPGESDELRESEETLRESEDNLIMSCDSIDLAASSHNVRMRSESTRKKKMKLISVSKRVKQMLDRDDVIRCCFNCVSIRGLDQVSGILMFGKTGLYILDHFCANEDGEINEIETEEGSGFGMDGAVGRIRWEYDDIRDFLKRNYLLCAVALEVFQLSGRSMYIVLGNPRDRERVYKQFGKLELPNHVMQVGIEVGKHLSAFTAVKRILSFQKSVTQRWQERDISNFEYLMQLNMIAGRSYNELNCYPVFPWVLADYTSEKIDLRDESVYRVLSKPMGTQVSCRLTAFHLLKCCVECRCQIVPKRFRSDTMDGKTRVVKSPSFITVHTTLQQVCKQLRIV